jgi:hypothetical protein
VPRWVLLRARPRPVAPGGFVPERVRALLARVPGYRPPNLPADAVFVE